MKLTASQAERFLRRPDPKAAAVLVYGPDDGLVRERVETLIEGALDDPHDPFRLSDLGADQLRADPARLADEARALTLTGGRRVIRVRQAGDQATAACKALLALDRIDSLVILDAGELAPGSSLRRLFEGASNAAALPCYRDQGRDLAGLVDRLLAEHGLEAEPDARHYLIEHLGADRAVTRAEIDKLAVYLDAGDGPARRARRRVTLEDVAAVIGDSAALGLEELVDAVALGEQARAQRCLDRLLGEGQQPVRIVRALANHFGRLQRFVLQVAAGEPPDRVIDRARPPVHFRRKDKVKAALRRWPAGRCATALARLIELEIACKTTGSPADLLCRAAVLDLARAAADH